MNDRADDMRNRGGGRPPIGTAFTLITKVTRKCNLRCGYCNEWEATKEVMSFQTVAALTKRALAHPQARAVTFIWHGGEPLVRGRKFYEQAMELQQLCARPGQQVKNAIQTNGTLVNEAWARFFASHGWDVGLSLDGPQELHDAQRPRIGGQGSHASAMRAIALFRTYGVRFGVLVVATDATLSIGADRMFDFLTRNGVRSFAFLHLRPKSRPDGRYDPKADYVSLDRFNQFQRRIFDRWYANDDPRLSIREFESIVATLCGGHAATCTLAGDCIGRHFGINVNGDVYHCDRYVTDADYRLGNVMDDSFETMLSSERFHELRRRNHTRVNGYQACRWLRVCHGGCPHNAYIDARSTSPDPTCCGEAALVEHIYKRVHATLQRAEKEQSVHE